MLCVGLLVLSLLYSLLVFPVCSHLIYCYCLLAGHLYPMVGCGAWRFYPVAPPAGVFVYRLPFCCSFYLLFRHLLAPAHGGRLSWQHSCYFVVGCGYPVCMLILCDAALAVLTTLCRSIVVSCILLFCMAYCVCAFPLLFQRCLK